MAAALYLIRDSRTRCLHATENLVTGFNRLEQNIDDNDKKTGVRMGRIEGTLREIMDIPVRTSHAGPIYQPLAQSGEWLEVDKSSVPGLAMLPESGEHHSLEWFKRYDDQWYNCLCTEDTYRLTADTEKIQVPHPVNSNPH
ncbi:hypothetical protein HOY80DRAFT_1135785 [Tuber brumale]|nr:hypothetical protein HOY80DRAFT_1135785 [Tuber brumale]